MDKPPGSRGAPSWIAFWEMHAGQRRSVCCAEGCGRRDVTGGHVKLARHPATAALLHTRWYIVPACPVHNR